MTECLSAAGESILSEERSDPRRRASARCECVTASSPSLMIRAWCRAPVLRRCCSWPSGRVAAPGVRSRRARQAGWSQRFGEGLERGCRDGRRRQLDRSDGVAAARRDGSVVRRGPCTVDARDVSALVHLRSCPSARRGRVPAADRPGWSGAVAAGRGRACLGRYRRHAQADLRLCQAGRRPQLHRRDGAERTAGDRQHAQFGAGDRRSPVAQGLYQQRQRRRAPRRRRAGRACQVVCVRPGS